jgi:hypothetical protein
MAAAGCVLLLPGAAFGSTATRAGDVVTVSGDPGETNNISIGRYENAGYTYSGVEVFDDGAPLTAGAGCDQVAGNEVSCGAKYASVVVFLGDGNDTMNELHYTVLASLEVHGGAGNDTINGSPLGDKLYGDEGDDTVKGADGNDEVYGGDGQDQVSGGSENDLVDGGAGQDAIEGDGSYFTGDGSDRILSRDGERDTVTCGLGTDTVTADSVDVLEGDGQCESVDQSTTPGPPGPGPGATLGVGLAAKGSGKIASFLSAKGFVFKVEISAACRATVKITVTKTDAKKLRLGRRALTLASATEDVPQAGRFAANLRALKKYRAKLRKLHRVPTTLSFSCTDGSTTSRATKKVVFHG